jgi:hypothetical protein
MNPATVGMTVLSDLGVGVVAVDRYKMPSGLEREYTDQLAAAIFAGQPPLFEDDRISVYRVLESTTPQPYLVLGEVNWGALQANAEGMRGRDVGDKPARLYFHHLPPDARLQIQYHTMPTIGLAVGSLDGSQRLATLPAAPTGNEVVLDLALLQPQFNETTPAGIVLVADKPNGALVEAIRIIAPR